MFSSLAYVPYFEVLMLPTEGHWKSSFGPGQAAFPVQIPNLSPAPAGVGECGGLAINLQQLALGLNLGDTIQVVEKISIGAMVTTPISIFTSLPLFCVSSPWVTSAPPGCKYEGRRCIPTNLTAEVRMVENPQYAHT